MTTETDLAKAEGIIAILRFMDTVQEAVSLNCQQWCEEEKITPSEFGYVRDHWGSAIYKATVSESFQRPERIAGQEGIEKLGKEIQETALSFFQMNCSNMPHLANAETAKKFLSEVFPQAWEEAFPPAKEDKPTLL